MKNWFLVFSLFCAGLAHGDDLENLTQVLRDLSGVPEIFGGTVSPRKLLIINVNCNDVNKFIEVLDTENKKSGYKLFSGSIEIEPGFPSKRMFDENDENYKIIMLFTIGQFYMAEEGTAKSPSLKYRYYSGPNFGNFLGSNRLREPIMGGRKWCLVGYKSDKEIPPHSPILVGDIATDWQSVLKEFDSIHNLYAPVFSCRITEKTHWLASTEYHAEFTDIYWTHGSPEAAIKWAKERGTPADIEWQERYGEKIKTIFDWLKAN